jgi:hypothetical protein
MIDEAVDEMSATGPWTVQGRLQTEALIISGPQFTIDPTLSR